MRGCAGITNFYGTDRQCSFSGRYVHEGLGYCTHHHPVLVAVRKAVLRLLDSRSEITIDRAIEEIQNLGSAK